MGTRGLNGFQVEGRMIAAYNQFDTYPSGLGAQVFDWTKAHLVEQDGQMVLHPEVLEVLLKLELVEQDGQPTPEQIERLKAKGITPSNVSTGADWYAWLREGQGDVNWLMRAGYWPDSASFGQDSLFCEWAWIVNTDDRALDCYQGFRKKPATAGWWATPDQEADRSGYYAIQRFWQLPFDELVAMGTQDFVDRCEKLTAEEG